MKKLAIVSLLYLEPEYKQTLNAIRQSGVTDVFFADRDGVGNMSRAFNDVFKRHVFGKFEYVWFITNVTFLPSVPEVLVRRMAESNYAALHPACQSSDHAHLHPFVNSPSQHWHAPFIELMAPMFRADLFAKAGMFPQDCWYWYMDLAVSYELVRRGYNLGCTDEAIVEHAYLRDAKEHPVTKLRQQMRILMKDQGRAYMAAKYGPNWPVVMGWKE